jgi:NADH-quinone oxidoreductase subunit J
MAFFEYLFLSLLGFCSFMVICSRNPLHSILSLISVFLLSSILVFCLEAEFLALSFILVYVGAIAILFLFVIIMSDIKISDSSFDLLDYSAFGYFFLFAIIVEILVSLPGLNVDSDLVSSTDYSWINWYFEINHLSNAQTLGQILYTDYFVFFLSAGFILFIALIGSLTLTVTLNKSYKLH